jgi:Lipocalin-like domain
MKHTISAVIVSSALVCGFFAPQKEAHAQAAKDLMGTWVMVSSTLEQGGKKTDYYGPNPAGQMMFDPNGHLSEVLTRSDLPKFASDNRQAGTPEENKAVVEGSIALFGTYTVNETDKTITLHIEGSTFPNWVGVDQKRLFKLSGDELNWTVPAPSVGSGTVYIVWKCAK